MVFSKHTVELLITVAVMIVTEVVRHLLGKKAQGHC